MAHEQYNVVLTGAAFMDSWAWPAYWTDAVKPARDTGAPSAVRQSNPWAAMAVRLQRSWLYVSLTSFPALFAAPCLPLPHRPLISCSATVDALFNGEDILMNFVLANASAAAGRSQAVHFVRPTVRGTAQLEG